MKKNVLEYEGCRFTQIVVPNEDGVYPFSIERITAPGDDITITLSAEAEDILSKSSAKFLIENYLKFLKNHQLTALFHEEGEDDDESGQDP